MARYDFEIAAGVPFSTSLSYELEGESALLSGETASFAMRSAGHPEAALALSTDLSFDSASRRLSLAFSAAETAVLKRGAYAYSVRLKEPDGSAGGLLLWGFVSVTEPVR